MVILSVHFLWQARTQGGFPYSAEHMAGEGHNLVPVGQPVQAVRPNTCIYGAHTVCQGVLVRIMAAYSNMDFSLKAECYFL